jgi:hypothetical protein
MENEKEHLLQAIEEAEQDVFDLENDHRDDPDNEELWIELSAAENHLSYLQSCLEDYE